MSSSRVTRRRMMQIGGASYLGLSLPQLLRAGERRIDPLHHDHANPIERRADACIVVFLNGGPSHLDMWDMKPDAPAEIRGEFRPIATSVAGILLSECLPRLARQMHHCCLARSVRHTVNNAHAAAVYTSLTGHDRGDATVAIGAGPDDYPAIGAILAQSRVGESASPAGETGHGRTSSRVGESASPAGETGHGRTSSRVGESASPAGESRGVVPFVHMPYITQEGRGGPPQPGFFGGWMGRQHDPFFVLRDPNAADFGMPELTPLPDLAGSRLAQRRDLVNRLDRIGTPAHVDAFRARAYDLLTSAATQRAFRIDLEPAHLRDAYGRNIYGQSTLLARRLIEAGTRLACISWAPDANATWDTHGQNFVKLRTELLPQLDMAIASLLNDLSVRGLLERTLVVVMGEFGRTPRVNAQAGRDHWNFCYSLLLAGGGIKPGYVHGASDRSGAYPSRLPLGPADVVATIYHCLGIPADLELRDRLHRPFTLVPWGSPVLDLLA